MKNSLVSIPLTLLAFLLHASSIAQRSVNSNPTTIELPVKNSAVTVTETGVAAANVDVKTRLDLERKFPDANEVTWIKNKTGFVAIVKYPDIHINVGYKNYARWIYTTKTYTEEDLLPRYVKAIVKGAYYDYQISHIQEINVPANENTIYLFFLQEGQNLLTVRVCDGEMNIIDRGIKG